MINIGDIQEEILLKSVLDTVSDGVTIIDPILRSSFTTKPSAKCSVKSQGNSATRLTGAVSSRV